MPSSTTIAPPCSIAINWAAATPWRHLKGHAATAAFHRADFDSVGRLDGVRIDADGRLYYLRNQSAYKNWIRVRLKGVRSLKLAQDALVEIKAGTLYRRQFYTGVPLLFDTGDNASVDVVRITWPNGLIQNEVRQAANQTHTFEEAQRLSGSCPMIWTWNGHEFQFVTDVLGVAPLGASNGDGSYFPVDHRNTCRSPARRFSRGMAATTSASPKS